MSETNGTPRPDWTPEQKQAIYAEMQKLFTVEDLLGYINDDEEKIPIDQVMAEAEEMLRQMRAAKQGNPT